MSSPKTDEERTELASDGKRPNIKDELIAIAERCASLPDLDQRAPDAILGYDKNGLPS